jgi:hypothetical protein
VPRDILQGGVGRGCGVAMVRRASPPARLSVRPSVRSRHICRRPNASLFGCVMTVYLSELRGTAAANQPARGLQVHVSKSVYVCCLAPMRPSPSMSVVGPPRPYIAASRMASAAAYLSAQTQLCDECLSISGMWGITDGRWASCATGSRRRCTSPQFYHSVVCLSMSGLQALQGIMDGCGAAFGPFLDDQLRALIFRSLLHQVELVFGLLVRWLVLVALITATSLPCCCSAVTQCFCDRGRGLLWGGFFACLPASVLLVGAGVDLLWRVC